MMTSVGILPLCGSPLPARARFRFLPEINPLSLVPRCRELISSSRSHSPASAGSPDPLRSASFGNSSSRSFVARRMNSLRPFLAPLKSSAELFFFPSCRSVSASALWQNSNHPARAQAALNSAALRPPPAHFLK